MTLIDTHTHLYWDSYKEDFDEMIQRAIAAGVSTIINIGVDVETSKKALLQARDLSKKLSVFSTIGIHPHESLQKDIEKDVAELEKIYLSDPKKVVAVGECGLDYKDIDEKARKLQKPLFQAQIYLAKKLNLPLVVHCREAWEETLEMLGDQPAVLHCYSGTSLNTDYILHTTNLTVSFAANITYPKNEYLREAAKLLPLDRILLETDSPFLAPQSKRGQRNEPSAVLEIARLIATLKKISFADVAAQTTANAKKVFKI